MTGPEKYPQCHYLLAATQYLCAQDDWVGVYACNPMAETAENIFFFGENSQKCHFTCHKPSFLGFPSHSQVCLIQTDSTALLRARCEHRSAVQPWPIFAPWCLIFHSCKTGIGILITFKNFNEYYCTRALILAKSWLCFRIQCCSSKTSTDGGEAPASLPLWVVLGCY